MAIAGIAHAKALETWCRISQLLINVAETRELIICTKQDLKKKESQIHLMADLLKLRYSSGHRRLSSNVISDFLIKLSSLGVRTSFKFTFECLHLSLSCLARSPEA